MEILRRTMVPHRHPNDYLEGDYNNVWKLTVGDYSVYGLYNWDTNSTLKLDYDFAYADLKPGKTYVGFDFWGNRWVAPFADRFAFSVAPDSCRVIAVREFDGSKPVLVSTSRHVASPVIDVADEQWDAANRVLSGTSSVIVGEDYEVRLYLPENWHGQPVKNAQLVQNGQKLRVRFHPTEPTLK